MKLPEVSDRAAVNYAKIVLGEDIDGLRMELSNEGRETVSDARLLEHLFGINETMRLKGAISDMCAIDFASDCRYRVMILTGRCNFIVDPKIMVVVNCRSRKSDPPSTLLVQVVERLTRPRGLGRMAIQPPPISEDERAHHARNYESVKRQSRNGAHP